MCAEKRPDGVALHVAVLDHQIVAGRQEPVQMLQHRRDVLVGVLDDEPGMRLASEQAGSEQRLRLGAVADAARRAVPSR